MPRSRAATPAEAVRRSREAWAELMAAYEASDCTQRAFCAEHGLAYSTFGYWRRRLRREETGDDQAPTLVELPVLAGSEAGRWRVELDLGEGLVLRLR